MARPSKYNWEAIKEAYEGGIDKDEIVKNYKLDKKQLNNKIYDEKWEVKGHISTDINEFYANVHKTTQNIEKLHPTNQEIAINKLNTMQIDNELMDGTRRVAKMLLGVIARDKNEINLKNIKTVSSTLKDIESIANPKPETIINNANVQDTAPIKRVTIMRRSDIIDEL